MKPNNKKLSKELKKTLNQVLLLSNLFYMFEIINYCFYSNRLILIDLGFFKSKKDGGCYHPSSRCIYINQELSWSPAFSVFIHELAHLIYHQYYLSYYKTQEIKEIKLKSFKFHNTKDMPDKFFTALENNLKELMLCITYQIGQIKITK